MTKNANHEIKVGIYTKKMATRIITFGEIMARLAPAGFTRFRQAFPGSVEITFAGAEANVAASAAMLGLDTVFVSAVPDHAVGDACVGTLQGLGVDTSLIKRSDEGRLGLYFVETGANQRPSNVIYDRDYSCLSLTPPSAYDWENILKDAAWLHTSGITPAVSQLAAQATYEAVQAASALETTVSIDLNFRKKLWRWGSPIAPRELAEQTMRQILGHVDVVIANEEDCQDVLGIRAENSDVENGHIDVSRYPEVARKLIEQFPNVKKVAITLRESVSASHNNWGAMLYDAEAGAAHFAPYDAEGNYRPYEIRDIVDRVGGGDSFAAGLICALNAPELADPAIAVRFAVASSCLAHSISGDFNYSTREEVERLMNGNGSGRVVR